MAESKSKATEKSRRAERAAQLRPASEQDEAKRQEVESKVGRPSDFTPEFGRLICFRIIEGETIRQICRDLDMPDRSTIARWQATDADFAAAIARAREAGAHALAEEALEIADDALSDVTIGKDGKATVNWESVQRAKLRVETRKWLASKLNPKSYGERVTQEVTGADGKPLMPVVELTDADRAKALAAFIARTKKNRRE